MARKKRPKQQSAAQSQQGRSGAALSPEEQAARRDQQKRDWAAQKRAEERARRSAAPMVWAGVAVGSLAAMAVLGFVLFAGGGGDSAPTPTATRDPRLGAGAVAKTVEVVADDEGQATNPTFSVTSITGNAGDIIQIDLKNNGSVAHNLALAGLDGEYGTPDDWITTPQTVQPGETGTVLVKFNDPGTYPYHCDFHPQQQRGNLILN